MGELSATRDEVARAMDDEINAVCNANSAPDADSEDLRSDGEIVADALLSRWTLTPKEPTGA